MSESTKMGGETIREYLQAEAKALAEKYLQFEKLIPNTKGKKNGRTCAGSDHNPEDGRFVESLIRETLRKLLPTRLEVLTGFIVRPAVKYDLYEYDRKKDIDRHSSQLDIIIFDSVNYPVFYRAGDTAIVPPEGVIAIISVKKKLVIQHLKDELQSLFNASKLCRCSNDRKQVRGPYLGLVAMDTSIRMPDSIYKKLESVYREKDDIYFDDAIGYIGVLRKWSVFKSRPETGENFNSTNVTEARYAHLIHSDNELHLGLQFLLTGIFSVLYDKTRAITRPGYTAFHRGNRPGFSIKVHGLRNKFHSN